MIIPQITNIADILFIVLIILFAVAGWKKGFIRMGFSLFSFVAGIIIGVLLYPLITDFLKGTVIYDWILGIISPNVAITPQIDSTMPFSETIIDSSRAFSAGIAGYLCELVLNIISFILVMLVVKIIISVVGFALNLFASLPVISLINRICGVGLGILEGMLIACIILAAVYLIPSLGNNSEITSTVESSSTVRILYYNNPIVSILLPDTEAIQE